MVHTQVIIVEIIIINAGTGGSGGNDGSNGGNSGDHTHSSGGGGDGGQSEDNSGGRNSSCGNSSERATKSDLIEAIIKAMINEDINGSQHSFMNTLNYGKDLYLKGKDDRKELEQEVA